jgi:hypothetical protein
VLFGFDRTPSKIHTDEPKSSGCDQVEVLLMTVDEVDIHTHSSGHDRVRNLVRGTP